MFESPTKFLLVENFKWLIDNLVKFVDPQFTYANKGLPNVVGGARRVYRSANHQSYYNYQQGATVTSNGTKIIQFPAYQVECEEWLVTHDTFTDPKLKERYPKATHVCLVTSRNTFKKNKKSSYYISCTCQDFRTTAEEELVNAGYCKSQSPALPPATGKKKLEAMPCKHIYAILTKEYQDIINAEPGPDPSASFDPKQPSTPSEPTKLTKTARDWMDKRVSQAPKPPDPVDPTPEMERSQMKALATKMIIHSLTMADGQLDDSDVNNYRKRGTKKVRDYKFFVMPNVGGFGYYGVSGYNAIGVMVTGRRLPLLYVSNNQEVDKKFIVKLYSLFTVNELTNLITAHTHKRGSNVIAESWSMYEYEPGVLVDHSHPPMINNIMNLFG